MPTNNDIVNALRKVETPNVDDKGDAIIPEVVEVDMYANEAGFQCAATNRAGLRCRKRAMIGQAVCANHGGKSIQNVRAGKKRLLSMADDAMLALQYAIDHGDISEAASAATKILDRAGLGPNITVDLNDKTHDDLSHLDSDALADKADALAEELRSRID